MDREGGIYGVNKIKTLFPEEFYKNNDLGESYETKAKQYLETGIYRLENFLAKNPDLEIYGTEQFFSINYKGHVLSGYIDRIFHNVKDDNYIIEDIKTKDKPFREEDLKAPLQFVIYTKALASMLDINESQIACAYDLPFCDMKQFPVANNYLSKGLKKLDKIFAGIADKTFVPHPSPLCAYCPFSETFENQPEEGKGLCCYYSLWTKGGSAKVWEVAHKWEGMEKNDEILASFFSETEDIDFDF